jgi:hypothetical protein
VVWPQFRSPHVRNKRIECAALACFMAKLRMILNRGLELQHFNRGWSN